jgi:putative endonuclease
MKSFPLLWIVFLIYGSFIKLVYYRIMFYVYILFSETIDVYYKGFTTNLEERILYHNSRKSNYTSKVSDWVLVYSKSYEIKKEALLEEKRLKKLNRDSIIKLISK